MELPLAKIKRIAKFDPDVKLVSHEGTVALALSCEMFIKTMAEHVYQHTRLGKRKTVQIRDFDACLQNTAAFSFLEGALETWTEVAGQPGANVASNQAAASEEQSDGNEMDGIDNRPVASEATAELDVAAVETDSSTDHSYGKEDEALHPSEEAIDDCDKVNGASAL